MVTLFSEARSPIVVALWAAYFLWYKKRFGCLQLWWKSRWEPVIDSIASIATCYTRVRLLFMPYICSAVPVAAPHSRTVLSLEADASCLPSGENATAITPPVWPTSIRNALPVA